MMSLGHIRKTKLCCFIWRLLLASAILVASENLYAEDSDNLVLNPGFELVDDNNQPLYWSNIQTPLPNSVIITSDSVHSGSHAWEGIQENLTMGGYRSGLSDAIPVESGCAYMLSAWLKSQTGSEIIYFGWQEYDDADNCIAASYFMLYENTVPVVWQQFAEVQFASRQTAYVRISFWAPYESIGAVWVDDVNLVKVDTQLLPPIGAINDSSAMTIEFGSSSEKASLVDYNSDAMGQPGIDGNIHYRELLPNKTLRLEFPAFNVDANGLPQSPMLLEIHFKDTISDLTVTGPSGHRAFVYSRIDYLNPDPLLSNFSDKKDICIASLGGGGDNQWKYKQYAFQKTAFQLLRSIDGKFTIYIEMPDDSTCSLPIDYVTLATITQSEYLTYANKERLLNGFVPASLPSDYPASEPNYSDLTIFTRDIMRPIYKFTKPSLEEITTTISAFSARGQIEPLSFAIYSENGLSGLTFDAGDLAQQDGNGNIDKSRIGLFHVVCDEKRLLPYTGKKRNALIPDRLEEVTSLAIEAHTSERFWIKVNIATDAQSGPYSGSIFVRQNEAIIQTVTIHLNVLPINLDEPQNLNPLYSDPYSKVFCSDSNQVLSLCKETGVDPLIDNSSELRPIVLGTALMDFDSSHFETIIDSMIQAGGAKDVVLITPNWIVPYTIIFGETATNTLMTDPNLYYNLSDRRFVNAFSAAIQRYQQIACGHIANNPQMPNRNLTFIYYAVDEPGNDPYKRILADRLYRILRHNNVLTATTYYENCDKAISPGFFRVPKKNGCDGNIPPLTTLIDYIIWHQGEKALTKYSYYTTLTSYLRNPIYNRFSHGFLAFRTDADIVVAYALGDMVLDPFNDFDAGPSYIYPFTYPDFIFAYPTWSGKLLPTMSLEGIREGIKDAKYIATLKRLINEDPNSAVSIQADNYLASVKTRISPDYTQAYIDKADDSGFYKPIIAVLSDSNDSGDFEAFTRIRQTIANYIVQLSKDVTSGGESNRRAKFLSALSSYPLGITKFTAKAGKTRGSSTDSFVIQGTFEANEQDIADANTIYLGLRCGNDFVFEGDVPLNLTKIRKNKYSYKSSDSGIYSAVFDLVKKTFRIAARKIDLTGLSSHVNVQIEWGNYRGQCQIDENILNGKQPMPVQLLTGYSDVLCVDKASVRGSQTVNSDSLAIKGRIAFKDTVDLSQHYLILSWGSQSFVIPAGGLVSADQNKYRASVANGSVGPVIQAAFNLQKCTFNVIVKNTSIVSQSGLIQCGIKFDTGFDQAVECILN